MTNKKSDNNRSLFSKYDGALFYGKRIVMPLSLQKQVLNDFHIRHLGILLMKYHMRSYVYRPNMNKDIEKL